VFPAQMEIALYHNMAHKKRIVIFDYRQAVGSQYQWVDFFDKTRKPTKLMLHYKILRNVSMNLTTTNTPKKY
jgi:hypothetical protein